MLREDWEFSYQAAKVAMAAKAKISHHESRLDFWKKAREDIIARIRSEGIEVDEKIVLLYSNPKHRDWDQAGEVMIRNDLRKELVECYKKLAYHTGRRDGYDGWAQVLDANPESSLALDIDDWLFFFGRDIGAD